MKENASSGHPFDVHVFLPDERPSKFIERRRDERFALRTGVRVSWTGHCGKLMSAMAAGKNISAEGAAFQMEFPLPVNLLVHVEFLNSRVLVSGRVRYCRPLAAGWRIGIKFTTHPAAPDAPPEPPGV